MPEPGGYRGEPDLALYTVEQIEAACVSALQARGMPAVAGLLRLLAIKAPDRAQYWLDAITLMNGDTP